MPTYDYECDACGHEMELFQGINDPVKKKCPECGKIKLRRLLGSGAAIMFKGSGFYQTDYRSAGYKKAAKAEQSSSEEKSSSGGTDSGGESKTAAASSEASSGSSDSSSSSKSSGND